MAAEHDTQLAGDILLHALYRIIFEFDNFATLFTNEVVVMVFAGDLITRLVFVEVAFGQQLTFFEQFESPVDSCVTDVGADLLYRGIKFLGTDMAADSKKHPGDIIAWRSRLQAAVAQPRVKQLHPLLGLAPA